jgi:hypothetical protein
LPPPLLVEEVRQILDQILGHGVRTFMGNRECEAPSYLSYYTSARPGTRSLRLDIKRYMIMT